MMKGNFFLALGLLGWLGCSPQRPGLVVQPYPFDPAGKSILIQHFAFNPGIARKVNQERVKGFGELIALDVRRYLKDAGFQYPMVIAPGEPAQGEFLIKGGITQVYGGSVGHRRWFESFGFGATEVRVVGEIVDLASSRAVATFSFTRRSSYTWLENEAAVRADLREIAQQIAGIVIQNRK